MNTLIKNNGKVARSRAINKKERNRKPASHKPATQVNEIPEGEFTRIREELIDYCPFNHRRVYTQASIEELAGSFATYGIIHALKVRPKEGGRYELVVGERRLRAAKVAGLKLIPANVNPYTDEEVREIQLLENLHRVNPHPLDDACTILQMQESGKTIDDIAARLGKTKQFVFNRLRISKLILPLQEVFAADKFSIQDAWDIAGLASESQRDFFEMYCKDWQKDNFRIYSVKDAIRRYKYDLKYAPFNIKDKKLLPDMGACTSCPFNSAVIKSLFPELAKEAVCQNKQCYQSKCLKEVENHICKAVADHKPQAILTRFGLSENEQIIIDSLDETNGLPQYSMDDITVLEPPVMPSKEDYTDDDEEGEEQFNEAGYQEDLQEYEEELITYNDRLATADCLTGICIAGGKVSVKVFLPVKERSKGSTVKVTAKAVQEAIKAGKATPELLQEEICRIEEREQRKQEIDRDKVQANVHQTFLNDESEGKTTQKLTRADYAALRLLVYQSLDWSVRRKVEQVLFAEDVDTKDHAAFFDFLADMPEEKFAFLIRMAVAGKSESKLPGNITGFALYQLAEQAGTDVAAIEAAQAKIASTRQDTVAGKITELNRKIKVLES